MATEQALKTIQQHNEQQIKKSKQTKLTTMRTKLDGTGFGYILIYILCGQLTLPFCNRCASKNINDKKNRKREPQHKIKEEQHTNTEVNETPHAKWSKRGREETKREAREKEHKKKMSDKYHTILPMQNLKKTYRVATLQRHALQFQTPSTMILSVTE